MNNDNTQEETGFFEKPKRKKLALKIAVVWFSLFTVNSLCSSIMGCLVGAYWSNMAAQDRFMMIVAIVAQWTSVMMAFMYNAASKVQHGELPIVGGASEGTATTTTTQTKTEVKPITT